MSTTATEFDLTALVSAIESDDPAAQAAAYSDDVQVEIQNRDHGPGAPMVLAGRAAVRALLDDVAARELEHRVQRAVSDGRTGALQVRCRYPDGASVTCSSAFDIEGGRIVRETRLEVWDS
jgi:hypothetical protein